MNRHLATKGGMTADQIPPMMTRQITAIGLQPDRLDKLLRSINSLDAWPPAWIGLADELAAEGKLDGEWRACCVAQRSLASRTPQRESIYQRAKASYQSLYEAHAQIDIEHPAGGTIRVRIDLPATASIDTPVPLVVFVTGLGVVLEELHDISQLALSHGVATARVDSPGWGATTMLLDDETAPFVGVVIDALRDGIGPRDVLGQLDLNRIMVVGTCIGAVFACMSAVDRDVTHVVSVSGPWRLDNVTHRWPAPVRSMVTNASGIRWLRAERRLHLWSRAARPDVRRIRCDVEVHAAGRDRITPVSDQQHLVEDIGERASITLHPDQVHACPGVLHEIVERAIVERLLAGPGSAAAQTEQVSNR
jgi:dienelactone hydrolase